MPDGSIIYVPWLHSVTPPPHGSRDEDTQLISLSKRRRAVLTILFRVLLTFNATSLLIVIYQIKDPFFLPHLEGIRKYFVNTALLIMPVVLTGLSIWLSRWLGKDSFAKGSITSIELANNSFLPSYLGYFFVALSIPNVETLVFVYVVLNVFTFFSQVLYFNPLFLLYNFKFYNATTKEGTVIFLISQNEYRIPSVIEIKQTQRINGYTFLERK